MLTKREKLLAAQASADGRVDRLQAQASDPVNLLEFEPLAKQIIAPAAYDYIAGGAGDEITLRANRTAFDRIKLKPRILVDVSKLDTRVTLFGQELPFPILLAPTSTHKLVHPEGELATVRGASAARAAMVISSFASTRVEEIAGAAKTPLWFQIYVQKDRSFTRDLVQRAEGAGCRALCVTVDQPLRCGRDRDARNRFHLPPGVERANFPGVPDDLSQILNRELNWKDIAWLKSFARAPVLLKGVLSPEDAEIAVKEGVSGIMVSNHGARNLDTVPATIEALPLISEKVGGRVPVLVDGGIRRGTDVLKALAMGASAVLIGRPYLYGLALKGDRGVTQVIDMLRTEFEYAMVLMGRPTLASINRSVLW